MGMKNWRESKMEKELKEKGWKFLTNEPLEQTSSKVQYMNDLRMQYKEVITKKAYDSNGNPLDNMESIYVR